VESGEWRAESGGVGEWRVECVCLRVQSTEWRVVW